MEFKLYRCAHCGNIIFKVVDKGVPVMCCGQKMEELVPNTTDGALENFIGTVEEVDTERGKVRVVVSMFGRETPVELELDQVEPFNS